MQGFAAIDIETSNNERSSVCSFGVVGRVDTTTSTSLPHAADMTGSTTIMPRRMLRAVRL